MNLRTVYKIDAGVRDDINDLVTRRALPTPAVKIIDPFLFLNHHGPQTYAAQNHGLPFGPHPHRGFETVTFILAGDIAHRDTAGHESVIGAGGVQWMTAGDGLIHEEVSSAEFMRKGGPLEILQLWVNLPARLKRTKPQYLGLQAAQIPLVDESNGDIKIQVVSGNWKDQKAAFQPLVDIDTKIITLKKRAQLDLDIHATRNIFFYVVRGKVTANSHTAEAFHVIQFNNDGNTVRINAEEDSILLVCHAEPFNEPVVSHGPFVMNTREEILEAIQDFQSGKIR